MRYCMLLQACLMTVVSCGTATPLLAREVEDIVHNPWVKVPKEQHTVTRDFTPLPKHLAGPFHTYKLDQNGQPIALIITGHTPTLNQQIERRLRYFEEFRRTQVVPHYDAEGDALELQERVVGAFARSTYVPPQRLAYFRWIEEEVVVSVLGWRGAILRVTRQGEGWLVDLVVRAEFYSPATPSETPVMTTDHLHERWYFGPKGLRFVSSIPLKDSQRGLMTQYGSLEPTRIP